MGRRIVGRIDRTDRGGRAMSVRMRDATMRRLGDLRHEPLETWIRATIGDDVVVDSTRAAGMGAAADHPVLRRAGRRRRRAPRTRRGPRHRDA